jgi:hypothetical protein
MRKHKRHTRLRQRSECASLPCYAWNPSSLCPAGVGADGLRVRASASHASQIRGGIFQLATSSQPGARFPVRKCRCPADYPSHAVRAYPGGELLSPDAEPGKVAAGERHGESRRLHRVLCGTRRAAALGTNLEGDRQTGNDGPVDRRSRGTRLSRGRDRLDCQASVLNPWTPSVSRHRQSTSSMSTNRSHWG